MQLKWISKLGGLYTWFLFLITFGLYGLLWFYESMNFINFHKGKDVYKSKKIIINIVVFIALVFIIEFGFIVQNLDKPLVQMLFMIFWLVNLGWLLFVLFAFYHLANSVRAIEEQLGIEKLIKPSQAVILFFLCYSSVIYVQEHIRKIVTLAKH